MGWIIVIWRAGMVSEPFTIYPGQRLRLNAPVAARTATRPVTAATPVVSAPPAAATSSPAATAPAATPVPRVRRQRLQRHRRWLRPRRHRRPVLQARHRRLQWYRIHRPRHPPPPGHHTGDHHRRQSQRGRHHWRWPSAGQVIGRFVAGDPTNQGINIAGSSGQPVLAAADGEVVYSGSGLIGYGELVIIRHSDVYLSAYGHNRSAWWPRARRSRPGSRSPKWAAAAQPVTCCISKSARAASRSIHGPSASALRRRLIGW